MAAAWRPPFTTLEFSFAVAVWRAVAIWRARTVCPPPPVPASELASHRRRRSLRALFAPFTAGSRRTLDETTGLATPASAETVVATDYAGSGEMPGGLTVDSSTGDIYFTDVGTGALTKASASDGWATTTLLSGLGGDDGLYDVALSCDGSYVYVSAPSDCAVYRAKVGSSAGGREEKKRKGERPPDCAGDRAKAGFFDDASLTTRVVSVASARARSGRT